eukprot:5789214-Amphidinium_carterae.1
MTSRHSLGGDSRIYANLLEDSVQAKKGWILRECKRTLTDAMPVHDSLSSAFAIEVPPYGILQCTCFGCAVMACSALGRASGDAHQVWGRSCAPLGGPLL